MAITKAGVEVVAVCDIDTERLKTSADELEKLQGARPKEYKDYQDLLDQKGLQAVFSGTPGRNQQQEEMDIPTQGMQERHVENFLNAVF